MPISAQRDEFSIFISQNLFPDQPFHSYGASKSGDRPSLCSSGIWIDGFQNSKIVNGSVGSFSSLCSTSVKTAKRRDNPTPIHISADWEKKMMPFSTTSIPIVQFDCANYRAIFKVAIRHIYNLIEHFTTSKPYIQGAPKLLRLFKKMTLAPKLLEV